MKVVHVIKKIEMIDNDVKELRKLEKYVQKNKSFTTPIYMSIEKQINILLGERIKLLELKIENPPEEMSEKIEGQKADEKPILPSKTKPKTKKKKPIPDDEDLPIMTQDLIDSRISEMESKKESKKNDENKSDNTKYDDSVKILDIALEKGTLAEEDQEKKKEKKVRFFRDNFPVE